MNMNEHIGDRAGHACNEGGASARAREPLASAHRPGRARLAGACIALAALAVSLPAAAHPGHAESGFQAGLLHPFTGLDHLLALLAVGLWSRQVCHGAVLAPAFLVMMALGAAAAGAGLALPALETSIAATVLLLGGLAACAPNLQRRLPPQLAIGVVGGCAFLHGASHGQELAGVASGAGFLLASALLMGLGALPGARLRRLAGAAIGLAGLCLLAGAPV
jgi:urease accessory protein